MYNDLPTACFGITCPKHEQCQRYADVETSKDVIWQDTCDITNTTWPMFAPLITPSRMIDKMAGKYVSKIHANQRNDGNKSVKSRGTPC